MIKIDQVVDGSHRIENLLRHHYHAEGDNLNELIMSCEDRLPHHMQIKLHQIAEMSIEISSGEATDEVNENFIELCHQCEKELTPRSNRLVWGSVIVLLCGFTLAALWFYWLHWHHIKL